VNGLAGLSTAEAQRRLRDVGRNEPVAAPSPVGAAAVARLFANPLVIILLLASAASAALGDVLNAAIIVTMVVLSVTLNFVQTYRSDRAARRLREQVVPRATVLRDGQWTEIVRSAVVPGDVIRLVAGDRVPADAVLLEARDLHVYEAALTGESMPVEKSPAIMTTVATTTRSDAVYLGTSVVSGTAVARVTATGAATALGDIAARLSARPPETEFERGLRAFAGLVMKTILFLILFVVIAGALVHRTALESLLFAVALAVGLTPEFLPMITTVTLTQGAIRMSHHRVVVKHLAAIEDFGSMDILCSDKTGTLTTGVMTLQSALDPVGQPAPRVLQLAAANSALQTGVPSPLDAAVLARAKLEPLAWKKVDEIPFDFERRCVSVVVTVDGEARVITKGAPEAVLERCDAWEIGGTRERLDRDRRQRCRQTHERLARSGAKVLAVAEGVVAARDRYTTADERALTLVGFIAFSDPLVPGVARALAALRRDGVRVKILTGDGDLVARHVCAQVGLDVERIVLGAELDGMTNGALAAVAEQTTVFARVSPAQKSRIIQALQSRDHVVGFLGDGINDAPSLHVAQVGVSVANAVDVARDAADIVLRERSLDQLHQGIIAGRRTFANVMKYLLMGTSSNFGNMFSMAGAAVILPFLPMLPTQILLNNFLYDLAQLAIPTDRVDPVMVERPRRWDMSVIRNVMLYIGPISSVYDFLTFGALLWLFQAGEELFHTGWFIESLATQTLVIFVIRTTGNPLRSRPSPALTATTLAVVTAGLVLPFTPLAAPLGFVVPPASFFVFLAVATLTYLALVEMVKRRVLRRAFGDRVPDDRYQRVSWMPGA
jgi:P-type Mg2+ transporter